MSKVARFDPIAAYKAQRERIRAALETWPDANLREMLVNAIPDRKNDMIDLILDGDLVSDDDLNEIVVDLAEPTSDTAS